MQLYCDYQYNPSEESVKQALLGMPEPWHPIIRKLIEDLFKSGWDGVLTQIKEKFGGLRFYIAGGSKEMFELIRKAEAKTKTICIECGKPATHTTECWVTYVCDEHKQ